MHPTSLLGAGHAAAHTGEHTHAQVPSRPPSCPPLNMHQLWSITICLRGSFTILHVGQSMGAAHPHSYREVCGLYVHKEEPLTHSQIRPADLLVNGFAEAGSLAADVSVVHPLQPSAPLAPLVCITPGQLADTRASSKQAVYKAHCSLAGCWFMPLIFETSGAWSHSTCAFCT